MSLISSEALFSPNNATEEFFPGAGRRLEPDASLHRDPTEPICIEDIMGSSAIPVISHAYRTRFRRRLVVLVIDSWC